MNDQEHHWVAISGKFSREGSAITFEGKPLVNPSDQQPAVDPNGIPYSELGLYMSDQVLAEGLVEAVVTFSQMNAYQACEIVLYYDPSSGFRLHAGLAALGAFNVRYFDGRQFINHLMQGDRLNLKPDEPYRLTVRRVGATVSMSVDGVDVAKTNLPWALPQSQVGLWCQSSSEISVSDFRVEARIPEAFVVMQFTDPFNDLYADVIRPVCAEYGVEARRADETTGPGFILQDIVQQIEDSTFVIADISEPNPNVFWEVGYAHAIRKHTILIADHETSLTFDVSGFRTLFYENSIAGKRHIEDGLRKYINAIMTPQLP